MTPDGTVKVLDFGLAKAFQADDPSSSASLSPTISLTAAATQMGMIIGTAAYMAPEQAKGKPVDKRADVWAFGAVLYEMLAGRRPFAGDDVSETLARVIDREPDWSALPDTVPPVLSRVLRQCLEKNPKRRVRDIGDVALAIEGAFEPPREPADTAGTPAAALHVWQRPLPLALGALAIAVTTGLGVWSATRPAPVDPTVTRFTIAGPGGQQTVSVGGGHQPVWAASGELFYRDPEGTRMMAVTVTTDPTLTIGPPVELFQGQYYNRLPTGSPRSQYDVTADGQRFLMVAGDSAGPRQRFNVVLNWTEELLERVPLP